MENRNINLNEKKRIKGHILLKFDNNYNKKIPIKKISNSRIKKQLNIIKTKQFLKEKKILNNNLLKYNTIPTKFNNYIIQGLIFDGKSREISTFKDLLFWNDEIECLKQFYSILESKMLMRKYIDFYNSFYNFLNIYPIYFRIGDCKEVMIGNYRRKKRYQNQIKKMRNNKQIKYKEKEENISLIIKNSSNEKINKNNEEYKHEKIISQSFTFSPDELLLNVNQNENMKNGNNKKSLVNTRNLYEKYNIFANSFDTIKSIVRNLSNKEIKKKKNENKLFKLKIKNVEFIKNIFINNKKKNLKIKNSLNLNTNNNSNKIKLIDFNKNKFINTEYTSKFNLKSLSSNNSSKKFPTLKNDNKIKKYFQNKNENSLTDRYITINNEKNCAHSLKKEKNTKFKINLHSSRFSPIRINKNLLKVFPNKKTINRLDIKKLNIL